MDLEYDYSAEVVSDDGNNDDMYDEGYEELQYFEVPCSCIYLCAHSEPMLTSWLQEEDDGQEDSQETSSSHTEPFTLVDHSLLEKLDQVRVLSTSLSSCLSPPSLLAPSSLPRSLYLLFGLFNTMRANCTCAHKPHSHVNTHARARLHGTAPLSARARTDTCLFTPAFSVPLFHSPSLTAHTTNGKERKQAQQQQQQ